MTAAPVSRALPQSERSSAMNRPVAPWASAAVAAEGHARDRLPRRKGEQHGLRLEPVQRRPGVEEILPILPIRPVMDLDQQSPPEARDPDRGRQMIDGRGGDNGEPDRREAGRFRRAQPGESAIELNRLQEPEPMAGQRRQAFEPLGRPCLTQRGAEIAAEIGRDRQPAHCRTSGGGGLRHKEGPIG